MKKENSPQLTPDQMDVLQRLHQLENQVNFLLEILENEGFIEKTMEREYFCG